MKRNSLFLVNHESNALLQFDPSTFNIEKIVAKSFNLKLENKHKDIDTNVDVKRKNKSTIFGEIVEEKPVQAEEIKFAIIDGLENSNDLKKFDTSVSSVSDSNTFKNESNYSTFRSRDRSAPSDNKMQQIPLIQIERVDDGHSEQN